MSSNILPDEVATDLLVRLKPKPGEPRMVAYVDGKLGFYMAPDAAVLWKKLLARFEAIAAVEGEERMGLIWDASLDAAHKRGLQ